MNTKPREVPAAENATAVFPAWPSYSDDEVNAAQAVLESGRVNYWTGDEGKQFESEFADYIGTEHAVAVSNGSQALGIALRALDLPPGAEIIVTPRTFIASVSEILLAGAVPVFADVELDSQNISAATIEPLINRRTAAIMVVHLAGWPCDMPAIMALAKRHDLRVIEDCAQAHGATVGGRQVGSFGDVAAFSFCQDKIMTTGGEGGMITTNDERIFQRCWSFKDHGKPVDLASRQSEGNRFRYVHESIGSNARLTEMQAAIGRLQLRKLDHWLLVRRGHAARFDERLQAVPGISVVRPAADVGHAYYKYYCFVRPERLASGWDRDRILSALAAMQVPCGSGICPEVYREAALADLPSAPSESLPNARRLGQLSLMFPVHPTLEKRHIDRMGDALASVMSRATA